jgi:hypothetical protein
MSSVQNGPKNKEMIHQFTALFPLVCARAALIRDKLNQPTAYSPVPAPRVIMRSNHSLLCFGKVFQRDQEKLPNRLDYMHIVNAASTN